MPFGLRVDYVIPSRDLNVGDAPVWHLAPTETSDLPVSDHLPVSIDVFLTP
jgi:endonuclease/exonuclease/phosphatase family metal-dependent hydrolase